MRRARVTSDQRSAEMLMRLVRYAGMFEANSACEALALRRHC